MTRPTSPQTTHELTKAFLYFRTASTAILNLHPLIEYNQECIEGILNTTMPGPGQSPTLVAYRNESDQYQADLAVWEDRLLEATLDLVHWLAVRSLGRELPREILGMIGRELETWDGGLPPLRVTRGDYDWRL
ncbi:hypothetical protein ACLMJK_003419 [Lecanora helva]